MRLRANPRTRLLQPRTPPRSQAHVVRIQLSKTFFSPSKQAAQVRSTLSDVVHFDATQSQRSPEEVGLSTFPKGPPDERTLKLGKSGLATDRRIFESTTDISIALRVLQERLPSVLTSPLPTEILSPHISLHLFPSTHPHLPNVSGRVAYHAALWTSPITWGRVPLVGNVKLKIMSERVVKSGPSYHDTDKLPGGTKPVGEKLIVRWKTCGKGEGGNQMLGKMAEWLGRDNGDGDFSGLFIFEFDEEGRILSHTIERAEQSGNWDQGVGKFVGLTDWLLGRLGRKEEVPPGLALGYIQESRRDRPGRNDR